MTDAAYRSYEWWAHRAPAEGDDVDAAPSLGLIASQVADELAWQERRGDALDSKAGVVLGFAGVLAGLSLARLNGTVGNVGLALPRSRP